MNCELKALKRIKSHEGYRNHLYRDPLFPEIITGGYGHNFSEEMDYKLANLILIFDFRRAEENIEKIFDKELLNKISCEHYYVLVELMFQLGLPRFKQFKKMITAINKEDFKEAANELRDSLYYRQVKNRAEELAHILES